MENYFIQKKVESKEAVDALFLYATEGILVIEDTGVIARANPSAEKLFGYEKGELIGKKVEALIPTRHIHAHEAHREKYSHSPHPRSMGKGMDLFGMRKDLTEFPVEISLSPYTSSTGKFVVAFIIDITVRKQAEERLKNYAAELERQVKNRTLILEEAIQELEQTKEELKAALEKEKELNELKTRFVSTASHEFRTPLATIMSSLSLVKQYGEQKDEEKQNKHINRIKSSIRNLTEILNDFLSVSKLEEGKTENAPEEFDLKQFMTDIVTEMQPLCKEGQKIEYAHTGVEIVCLDKKLLKNILFNLISNAIKFSPGDKPINIHSGTADLKVSISIEDFGIGISKEDQKHLFESFFRAHNATHIQGTGLGLNIVARYVELMSGSIDFKSEENIGTLFAIKFPQ